MLLEIARNFYFNIFFPPSLPTAPHEFDFIDDEDGSWVTWETCDAPMPIWLESILVENDRLKAAEATAIAWSVSLMGLLFIGAQTWLLTKV